MTPEEQHALFVKTAYELGGEEVGEAFERAFDKVAMPKTVAAGSAEASSKPSDGDKG
jgi:hypothetical protein